ncbi:MAG TPA: hypothetical protein VN201_12140, partial [Roseateles sp.]|nr:hypothetical protein [Roseateles sp.]
MEMRILEVAIGLLLVVAITTLMATVLHELWTSLRKQRGDSWFLGVCSLLGDDQVTVGKLRRSFMPSKRPSAFTKALMSHPLLVSQTLGGDDKIKAPSYLGSDVFVSALLDQLSGMYTSGVRTATPREWINIVKAGVAAAAATKTTGRPNDSLVMVLETLVHGVSDDWPTYEQRVRAWYDSVMERAAGWYKRDTQLRLAIIGFLMAAAGNINPLVIGPRLWNDPPLRAALNGLADQAVKEYASYSAERASAPSTKASAPTVAPSSETRRPAKPSAANGLPRLSLAPTPESLETDQVLQSLSDAITIRADTRKSSTDVADANLPENLRGLLLNLQRQVELRRVAALDDRAVSKVFDGSVIIEKLVKSIDEQARPLPDWPRLSTRLRQALRDERDSLLPANALGRRGTSALSAAQASQVCVGEVDEATQRLCEPLAAMQSLAGSALPVGWSWANWPGCDGACQLRQRRGPTTADEPVGAKDEYAVLLFYSRSGCTGVDSKLCEDISKPGTPRAAGDVTAVELRSFYTRSREIMAQATAQHHPRSTSWTALTSADASQGILYAVAGWLMIGFAACLGAPFWFDLLARFVKMRGSGAPTPSAGGAEGDTAGKAPPPAA